MEKSKRRTKTNDHIQHKLDSFDICQSISVVFTFHSFTGHLISYISTTTTHKLHKTNVQNSNETERYYTIYVRAHAIVPRGVNNETK